MAPNPDLACGILTNIGQLWLEEEFCDLTINIDDYQFRCHKFHLSANSAFFKTLLRSEKSNVSKTSISHVTIRGITPEIFGLVLKAVYKGENCLDEKNIMQVWHATHELQIDVLVSKCEDFVMAHMTLDNYEKIYHSSVLLESARVKDFVVKFMAKNFDTFRQTPLFLDLPSKFLMDIVISEALVVKSRENLVDSIFMWANHKFEPKDESDDNTVVMKADGSKEGAGFGALGSGTNVSSFTSADPVTKTKEDKQCVEIMFSQPLAGLEDESSRRQLSQILHETARREETLGKLLNLAKLEQTSPDYLKSLVDNDWLMGNKETRHIVWTASVTQTDPAASLVREKTPDHPTHVDKLCEDVFVYQLKNPGDYVAHRWTTGKRYTIEPDMYGFFRYLSSTYRIPPTFSQQRLSDKTMNEFKIGETELVPGNLVKDASHVAVVGEYMYCFEGNKVYRTSKLKDMKRRWVCVGELAGVDFVSSVAVHKHHIVLFHVFSRKDKVRPEEIKRFAFNYSSFDTSNFTFQYLGRIDLSYSSTNDIPAAVIFFHHKDQLYTLNKDGKLFSVNVNSDPGKGLTEVGKGRERLWSGCVKLYGAATWKDELVIFADLPADQKILPTYSEDLGLLLKFQQVLPCDRCYRVSVAESLLQNAV